MGHASAKAHLPGPLGLSEVRSVRTAPWPGSGAAACSARTFRPTGSRARLRAPRNVDRLRAIHTPPSCRPTACDSAPQPPRRWPRSRRPAAVTRSRFHTATTVSPMRRKTARWTDSGDSPLAEPATRKRAPGVHRIPDSVGGHGRRSTSRSCGQCQYRHTFAIATGTPCAWKRQVQSGEVSSGS